MSRHRHWNAVPSTPVATSLAGEFVSRFGLVVSDKVTAGAVPIPGAIGGATINVIFMHHVQRIARGLFTLQLQRSYGAVFVRWHDAELATATPRAVR